MPNLFWHEDHDSGVDACELFGLLREHGFVDGDYRTADTGTRRRVEALGVDLAIEVTASEGERAYAACPERHVESCADLERADA